LGGLGGFDYDNEEGNENEILTRYDKKKQGNFGSKLRRRRTSK
jgi:hypothetical protein